MRGEPENEGMVLEDSSWGFYNFTRGCFKLAVGLSFFVDMNYGLSKCAFDRRRNDFGIQLSSPGRNLIGSMG